MNAHTCYVLTIYVSFVVGMARADSPTPIENEWRGPRHLLAEPEGTLLVVCEKSGTLARLNAAEGRILQETRVGAGPFALAEHPDGKRLYVSCRQDDSVVELDRNPLAVVRRFSVRGGPTGMAVSGNGETLFVGVHSLDGIAVIRLDTGEQTKRLIAGNGPEYFTRDPVTGDLYLSNLLSNPVPHGLAPQMEVTVVDDDRGRVIRRVNLSGNIVGRKIAFTSDGTLGLVPVTRPRNLIPFTQVARGWCMGNGFAVFRPGEESEPVTLLVDRLNRYYPDPHGLTILPDDRKAYMACSAADTVLVLDMAGITGVLEEVGAGTIRDSGEHLGLSRRFVIGEIAVGTNPTGVAASPDGHFVFVANRLEDSISVLDTSQDAVARTIVLGTPPEPDAILVGERNFHSARASFQEQIGCISCHPDTGFDGLTWDLEPDGMGANPLDNRNLRGIDGTAPFKWNGKNPDVSTQCGTRTAKWIFRTQGFSAGDVAALSRFIHALAPVRNPYRGPDEAMTPAQRRGKVLFERTTRVNGEPLAPEDRCSTCHGGEKFSNFSLADVGTSGPRDTDREFDSAHLINVFESPPYLHDGQAGTLEEIWTQSNPHDTHGYGSEWTAQELNDLIEYLKSL